MSDYMAVSMIYRVIKELRGLRVTRVCCAASYTFTIYLLFSFYGSNARKGLAFYGLKQGAAAG